MAGIKSIRLISNNMSVFGHNSPTDEVEQHLTVSSSGRVWFSARNYEQYCRGKGFCRRKQLNIGPWKAAFLLRLFGQIHNAVEVTDSGTYELTVRYESGEMKTGSGSLVGGVIGFSHGKVPVDITRLLRRYIPVHALWGFDSRLSPDYEGKKEIFLFARKWEKAFLSQKPSEEEFEGEFGNSCISLGFQMDGGAEFRRLYNDCLNVESNNIEQVIDTIQDIDLLGSAALCQWRLFTHWDPYMELDENVCKWYSLVMGQIRFLTERKAKKKKKE